MSNEVPLHQVIEFIFGKQVLKINTKCPKDEELVCDILKALERARYAIDRNPIQSARPNEVGNLIEMPIRNALSDLHGYTAATLIDVYDLPCKLKREWNSNNTKMDQQPQW